MSIDPKRRVFWLDDIKVLYHDNNYVHFIPEYSMTRVEQLNAITRFCIYAIILLYIFKKNNTWMYIPIITIVLTVILYYIHVDDTSGSQKDVDRLLEYRTNAYDGPECFTQDGDNELIKLQDETEDDPDKSIETGYYDSDGKLVLGQKYDPPKYCRKPADGVYTIDELLEYDKATCRKPTKDNPFMNPNTTEYNNSDPPMACNVDDVDIKENMTKEFNKDLYRDIDDLWERNNSQRQFYTVPNTQIPNNQTEFAEWLYKIPETCKEDQEKCLRYEDIRFKR
jgi:hypothetical protein